MTTILGKFWSTFHPVRWSRTGSRIKIVPRQNFDMRSFEIFFNFFNKKYYPKTYLTYLTLLYKRQKGITQNYSLFHDLITRMFSAVFRSQNESKKINDLNTGHNCLFRCRSF